MTPAVLTCLRKARAGHISCFAVEHSVFWDPWACIRTLQTRAADFNRVRQELQSSRQKPVLIPFKLTAQQAESAFEAWHSQHFFSPTGLLQHATQPIRAAYAPFWLFRAHFHIEYSGQVGSKTSNNNIEWENVSWRDKGISSYDYTASSMQVYASYRYRRDLVSVLSPKLVFSTNRKINHSEAETMEASLNSGHESFVDIDAPDMKQSIAWILACKAVKEKETKEAEMLLKDESGCDSTKDVQVRMKTLRRSARLAFLPIYVLDYQYGEMFDPHGNRKPHSFQAFISGVSSSEVAAERLFSPLKVQVGAALAMGVASAGAIHAGFHGQETLSLASSFLSVLLVCTSAGLAARLAPEIIRQSAEDERILVEDVDMEKIMSQGLGPQDVMDDKHEALRNLTEWRRWEEANKWMWDGPKRQRWAEALWRRQHIRRVQLAEHLRNKARVEAKYKFEQENEARRRARYGPSSTPHNPFSDGSGQPDFKGYYALLGLDGSLKGAISQPDIKAAFRKVAMRWHPDKLQVDSEQERQRAYAQFAKVQRAYDVLQSTASRKEYDSGIDPP